MTLSVTKGKAIGAVAALLLGALVTVAVFAEPGGDPPGGPSGAEPTATGEATATPTPEGTDATPTDEPVATGTPEPAETPDANEAMGVPLDSPACAGDLDHPNPHDTDGDGDGCRPVETEDGEMNLPDPAADAHDGNPGDIGDEHRPPHAGTPGPPEGDPPHGNAYGHDDDES